MTPRPGPFRLLVKHFWNRFFLSEHARYDAAAREKVSGVVAILAVAFPVAFRYVLRAYFLLGGTPENAWTVGAYFFGLAMVVSGTVAILAWDHLYPDEMDRSVLTALPLSLSQVAWAKAVAVAGLLALVSVALSAFTAVIFALYLAEAQGIAGFARVVAGYFAGGVLAGATAFLACGVLHGLAFVVSSRRSARRTAQWLQALAVFGLVCGFALMPFVIGRLRELKALDSPALYAVPPAWFSGFATAAGFGGDVQFARLGVLALGVPGLLTFLFLVLTAWGLKRHERLSEDRGGPGRATLNAPVAGALNALLLRRPRQRATAWFFAQTLWRSPRHRLRLLTTLSAAAGWVFVVQAGGLEGLKIAAPLTGFLAVAAAWAATRLPLQEKAAWVVRLTETPDKREYASGLRRGVWFAVLLPLFVALAVVLAVTRAVPNLAGHLLFHALCAAALAELFFAGLRIFPFSSVPGPGHLYRPLGFIVGLYAYVTVLSVIEGALLDAPLPYAVACTLTASLLVLLILRRRQEPPFPFDFNEPSELLAVNLLAEEEE